MKRVVAPAKRWSRRFQKRTIAANVNVCLLELYTGILHVARVKIGYNRRGYKRFWIIDRFSPKFHQITPTYLTLLKKIPRLSRSIWSVSTPKKAGCTSERNTYSRIHLVNKKKTCLEYGVFLV